MMRRLGEYFCFFSNFEGGIGVEELSSTSNRELTVSPFRSSQVLEEIGFVEWIVEG